MGNSRDMGPLQVCNYFFEEQVEYVPKHDDFVSKMVWDDISDAATSEGDSQHLNLEQATQIRATYTISTI
ncbi:hypothetical protein YC2023_028239 [Brassica napus]